MKLANGKERNSTAGEERAKCYLAMHETKLAQCLASGFLSPWPRGAEVLDHHVVAGRLVLGGFGVSHQAIKGAMAKLDYGKVAIIEVDLRVPFGTAFGTTSTLALPISSISRVCFDSREALEEFEARISGFDDIEPGVVRLEEDSALFPCSAGADVQEDWVAAEAGTRASAEAEDQREPNDARKIVEWLDRTAGSLAATFAAVPLPGEPEIVDQLSSLAGSCGPIEQGPSVPTAVAALLDHGPESQSTKPVLVTIERLIRDLEPAGGLDPSEVVERVRQHFHQQGATIATVVSGFLDWAGEIVSARRELPPNAFSDKGGSITLRALLLFLIQPDADRMSAVWHQAENLGPRVFCLYSALIGFYSGFSSLPVDIKGSVARALAVPELALGAMVGEPLEMEIRTNWDAIDGSKSIALEWRDKELCRVRVTSSELLNSCADAARSHGFEASFDSETGELSIKAIINKVDRVATVALIDSLPVFPRCQGLEMMMQFGARFAKKAVTERLKVINDATRESGVFATSLAVGHSNNVVLHAFLMPPPLLDAVSSAFQSLVSKGAELEQQAPVKKRIAKSVDSQ